MTSPFNSPLETGLRSLVILTTAFPRSLDLRSLVFLDYLTIHSGDVGGPESIHPPLPMRSGELTVRRELVERGLLLMMSRGLVERQSSSDGFSYIATESSGSFLSMLSSRYLKRLRERALWVVDRFGDYSPSDIRVLEQQFFQNLSNHFQLSEYTRGDQV